MLGWAGLLKILQLLQNVLGPFLEQQRGVILDDQHSVRPKQVQDTLLCDNIRHDCCAAGSWTPCKALHGVLDLQQQWRCTVSQENEKLKRRLQYAPHFWLGI